MQRYRCHKVVQAARIFSLAPQGDGRAVAKWENPAAQDGHDVVMLPAAYVAKHQPVVGGYFVRYEDGYESFSPAAAFESGYTLITD